MALRFDASGDVLSRTTSLPAINAFTIMAWAMIVTDRNNYSTFMGLGDTSGGEEILLQTDTDGTTFNLWNGIADNTGSALSVGAWNHLAVTCSGTGANGLLGYLNGVVDITTTASGLVASQTMRFGNSAVSEFLNGTLGAIKVYGAVLTAAEIATEMRSYVPVRWTNLNSWYPLLTTANDFYTGGLTLTTGGTTVAAEGPPIPWKRGLSRYAFPTAAAPGGALRRYTLTTLGVG
jgi:hypothetical protein